MRGKDKNTSEAAGQTEPSLELKRASGPPTPASAVLNAPLQEGAKAELELALSKEPPLSFSGRLGRAAADAPFVLASGGGQSNLQEVGHQDVPDFEQDPSTLASAPTAVASGSPVSSSSLRSTSLTRGGNRIDALHSSVAGSKSSLKSSRSPRTVSRLEVSKVLGQKPAIASGSITEKVSPSGAKATEGSPSSARSTKTKAADYVEKARTKRSSGAPAKVGRPDVTSAATKPSGKRAVHAKGARGAQPATRNWANAPARNEKGPFWLPPPSTTRTNFATLLKDMLPEEEVRGPRGHLARFIKTGWTDAAAYRRANAAQRDESLSSAPSANQDRGIAAKAVDACLSQEATTLRLELQRLNLLLLEQERINHTMRSSTSWLMTAPLRACADFSRRLVRKGIAFPGLLLTRRPPAQVVSNLVTSGDVANRARNWGLAVRYYREALELDPSLYAIWVQLGHALKEAGDALGAEDAYERANQLAPDDADLALSRGHLAKIQGKMRQAAFFYQKSFEIDGNEHARDELSQPAVSGILANSGSLSSSELVRMSVPQNLRIVAIGDGPIPSIFLGLDMPLRDISRRWGGQYSLHYETEPPTYEALEYAHVVFMKRLCSDAAVAAARFVRQRQIPLVYMLDDDFDQLAPESPLGRRYRDMNGPFNIRQVCELADYVVTWTRPLAEKLRPYARQVLQFDGPSNVEIFDTFPSAKRDNDLVILGYAGSATHCADLEMIKPAVLQILQRHPNVHIESIGMEIAWLNGHPRYKHFPGKSNIEEYYRLVASRGWDVGLAPLQETAFNASKSDNKFREYAAAGIPSVYSRTESFVHSVRDGENGLLCVNTTDAWTSAMDRMILEPALRARIKSGAFVDARGRLSREQVQRQYERLIAEVARPYRVIAAGSRKLASFAIDIDSPFRILDQRRISHIWTREIEHVSASDLEWATTLVVVRAFEPPARDLIARAKKLGVKTIYSWDDNWVAYPADDTPLSRHIHAPQNRQSLFEVLRSVDLIKGTTPEIDSESRKHNASVLSFPYGFDFDLSQHRPPCFRRDGRIRVGYFGTPGRDAQFDFVIEALKIVQQRHSHIDLEFFGFNPIRASELMNVKHIPYADDYNGSVRVLLERQWDIGLAPLLDTLFNSSKLPTKYRDHAAAGAAGVYTRISTYERVVENYKTGLLVDNSAQAWADAMSRLIKDDGLREAIARESFEHVRRDLSAERAADHWVEVLRAVHKPRGQV